MIEEVLFGLTMIFVGWVLYEVFKVVKSSDDVQQTHFQPSIVPESKPAEKPAPARRATPKPKAESQAAAEPEAAPAPAVSATEENKGVSLRDPVTGDISPIPSNYRFAKKWIKEALVTEGLLPKVYKNSELKGDLNGQVKDALEKFKDIGKYQAE
jgi:hypothetical protein